MIDYNDLNQNLPSVNDYLNIGKTPINTNTNSQNQPEPDGFLKSTVLKVGSDLINQGLGASAVISDKLGNTQLRDNLMQESQEYTALSNRNSRDYQDVTKINNVSDAGKYLGFQGINTVANILPVLLASRFGGAGITAGAEGIGALTGEGVIKGVVDNLVKKQADKLAMGTIGGLQNLGQVNAQNITEKGEVLQDNNAEAFATGAVLGTLEGNKLLGKYGQTDSRLANAGITGLTTGAIGVTQSAINRDILGKNLTSPDALNEYINAGASGFVGGAPFGLGQKVNSRNAEETIRTNDESPNDSTTPIDNDANSTTNIMVDDTINQVAETDNLTPVDSTLITEQPIITTNLKDLGDNIIKTIDSPFEDSVTYITDENNNKINNNFNEDKPLLSELVNYEEVKPDLTDLTEMQSKKVNDISNLIKNEDGTISQENSNMLNNIVEMSKTDSKNYNRGVFLEKIKIAVEEKIKKGNFTDEDARNVNAQIESVLPKKQLAESEVKVTEDNPLVQDKEIVTPVEKLEESNTLNVEELNAKFSSNEFKNKVNNLSSEQVYQYITDAQVREPLSIQEKLNLSSLENQIKPIKDNVGVDIVVVPEKYSPFMEDGNAWFDDKNNRIVLVGTKETKQNIQGVVFHELWHKGISLMAGNKGLDYVTSQFNELYKNKLIQQYADNLMAKGMERNLAIEESVGYLTQSNSFKDTPFLNKVYQSIKNMINKLVGRDMELSNEDVKAFFKKTVEPIFKTPEEETQANNVVDSIFKFSRNSNDEQVRDLRSDNENRGSFEKLGDYFSNINNKDVREGLNKVQPTNVFLQNIYTQDALLRKVGAETIYNIGNKQNNLRSKLENQYNQNSLKMDRIVKDNKLNQQDLLKLNKFLSEKGYMDNEGSGVRITETDVRNFLAGKVSGDKLNALVEYSKVFRVSADDNIYLNAFKESLSGIDSIMSGLRKTNKDTSEKIEAMIQQSGRNVLRSDNPDVITVRNINEKLNQILSEDDSKLTQETKDLLKPIVEQVNQSYEVAKSRFDYGYIPKDFKGKYVVNIIDPASGQSLAIIPFETAKESANFYARVKQQLGDSFIYDTHKRGEPISSNFDINKSITELRKNGFEFTQDQLKQYAKVGKIASEFERTYKGYGFNEKLANVVHDSTYQNISEASKKFLNSDKYDFINSFEKNSVERNTMVEVMKQMENNLTVSDATVDKGLRQVRSLASTFALGLNLANSMAQVLQSTLVGINYASKYGTSGLRNVEIFNAIGVLTNGMKSKDPLTQKVIDELRYNDLLGGSMTKQIFEDTKKFHDKNSFDNFKEVLYKPNELAEKTLRMSTLLRSIDVYKMAQEGKLSPELNDKIKSQDVVDFVSNELAIINGDFSKEYRSKVLEGEFSQTLLMFQAWKAMTLNAYQQMDMQGKIMFIASNIVAGGIMGFPFAQDIEESVDFFAKMFGENMPAEKLRNRVTSSLADIFGGGETANQIFRSGIPGLGERVGLGSLIPSLKGVVEMAQGDTAQGFKDAFGPASNFVSNIIRTAGSVGSTIASGNISNIPNAITPALPGFAKNAINGIKTGINDYNVDERGNKILNDVSDFDSALMVFGLNNSKVSNDKYKQRLVQEYNKGFSDIRNSYINQVKKQLMSNSENKGKNIVEIIKEARQFGYNIDLSSIIDSGIKNKDATTRLLNNMSLKDRIRAKKELGL